VRVFMNGLTLVSLGSIGLAAAFFFATAMSLNLAIAIYRRAEKSFVVDNLFVILLLFAEELLECRIPPMIIQPLVENAVIHGISASLAGGQIVVVASRIDSKLRISVQDDGVGFDCRNSSSGHSGIGLQNIRSRIRTLDPANDVHIDSKPGAGTTVTFDVPLEIRKKEEYANTDR
jgi:LytS/YehU family sensor histidine kinase